MDTLWDTIDCFWVNHPRYSTALMTKVAQTHYAGEVGFRVPRTLVSTKKNELMEFYEKCDGKVVAKQLGNARGAQDWISGRLYTKRINREDLVLLANAGLAPVMFQEAIEKKVELRITVVGDEVFAVEIHSQDNKNTSVDWRHGPVSELLHTVYKLPVDVKGRLLKLHKKLGLVYSGTDMIVNPEGEYVLLELNPNGEYVWTEILTKMPITEALCDLLLEGGDGKKGSPNPAARNI